MLDVMQDLETLGTKPGCVILSIGAVGFDGASSQVGPGFYTAVSVASCLQHGLTVDQDTLNWWKGRTPDAQAAVFDALSPAAPSLPDALDALTAFLAREAEPTELRLWGNGSDFDNVVLAAAYQACGKRPPWRFWNGRCFRTLKNIFPGHEPRREGVHHNALDDALHQARHALAIAAARRAV